MLELCVLSDMCGDMYVGAMCAERYVCWRYVC